MVRKRVTQETASAKKGLKTVYSSYHKAVEFVKKTQAIFNNVPPGLDMILSEENGVLATRVHAEMQNPKAVEHQVQH